MRQYSEWETMKRVWDVEEIKDLMSRRAVYSANEERERELKELWVNQPDHMATASFGRNYGYYVGMDAIRSYYVDSHQTRIDALSGTGYMECHTVTSPYVELAGDGNSARGLWYSIGQETYPGPDGAPRALWVNDKVAPGPVQRRLASGRNPDGDCASKATTGDGLDCGGIWHTVHPHEGT